MNWTEYREQVFQKVGGLTSPQKLKFALEICEKLLPDYRVFQEDFDWGNLDALKDGIALCKQNADGHDTETTAIKIQLSEIDRSTPDTEDFGQVSGSLALNAAAAIGEALNYILDNKEERISNIASLSYDSVYLVACENYPKLTESEIENHHDVQKEINWQLEKLKWLTDSSV